MFFGVFGFWRGEGCLAVRGFVCCGCEASDRRSPLQLAGTPAAAFSTGKRLQKRHRARIHARMQRRELTERAANREAARRLSKPDLESLFSDVRVR